MVSWRLEKIETERGRGVHKERSSQARGIHSTKEAAGEKDYFPAWLPNKGASEGAGHLSAIYLHHRSLEDYKAEEGDKGGRTRQTALRYWRKKNMRWKTSKWKRLKLEGSNKGNLDWAMAQQKRAAAVEKSRLETGGEEGSPGRPLEKREKRKAVGFTIYGGQKNGVSNRPGSLGDIRRGRSLSVRKKQASSVEKEGK